MNLASAYFHFSGSIFENALIFLLESLNESIADSLVSATYFAIMDMKANDLLFPVHHSVGNTGIVGFHLESFPLENLAELEVAK